MKKQKMIQVTLISLLIMVLFAGCCGRCKKDDNQHKRNALTVQFNQSFTLKLGEIAWIENDNLFIEFIEITEDSRCPVDVICAWEGQATALIGFYKNEGTHAEYSLTSRAGHPNLAVTEFDNYVITLTELLPEKIAGETIEIADYDIELTVSKTGQ